VGALPGSFVSGILTTKARQAGAAKLFVANKNDKALLNRTKPQGVLLFYLHLGENYRATVWPYLNQQLTEEENA